MFRFRAISFSLLAAVTLFNTSLQASASGAGNPATMSSKSGPLLRKAYNQMIDGDHRDAVDTQIMAVKADRDNVNARRYLSYSLLKLGASDEAMQQLRNLLSMTRATPVDMCMCGEALFQAGRLNQAEKWFKEALSSAPSMNSALLGLSNVAAKRKNIALLKANTIVSRTEDDQPEKELVAAEFKTTFELGKAYGDGTLVAHSSTTSLSQNTHSFASDTARQLRNGSANQQVATMFEAPGGVTSGAVVVGRGNNQVLNAWAGFKGVQKR